ncbi:universal stress protein [Hymenobacter humi]|uniref:Universal stress protein n=1 Tax=Hymenobacter humi TaxID=1411620 RepID=A0ABW2U0G1_9BACT
MDAPTLLVLTDFFKASSRALDYATNLAAPLKARLVLLHVRRDSLLDPEALVSDAPHLSTSAVKLALDSLVHKLPVPAVTEVGHGRVLPAVADAVKRHRPALIVLSRPNWDEVPDEVNSTTAVDILQDAPYPMLVVPPTVASTASPRRLLLAADGEPFALGDFGPTAQDLLQALHAEPRYSTARRRPASAPMRPSNRCCKAAWPHRWPRPTAATW